MKRCIVEHVVPSFGVIPVGSLWDDDSPYVREAAAFEDVDAETPASAPKPPVRKFGGKKV